MQSFSSSARIRNLCDDKFKKINAEKVSKVIITVILGVISIGMMLPLLWMIVSSMKVEVDVFKYPVEWIPKRTMIIKNYKDVWMGSTPFALYYWNSIKVVSLSTIICIFISCLGGYGFSRIKFKGRDTIFLFYIATMVIPEQVTLLPRFLIFKQLHLFNTHYALVMNSMVSIASVFLIRQYMASIPFELSESARIDGAGHLRIFWEIIAPLSKPAIATMAILKFIWTWNDYQNPLIFLNNPKLFTIQLGVRMFADANGEFYSLIMAAAVSAILPLFIVFFFGQRYILEGIVVGGVKG